MKPQRRGRQDGAAFDLSWRPLYWRPLLTLDSSSCRPPFRKHLTARQTQTCKHSRGLALEHLHIVVPEDEVLLGLRSGRVWSSLPPSDSPRVEAASTNTRLWDMLEQQLGLGVPSDRSDFHPGWASNRAGIRPTSALDRPPSTEIRPGIDAKPTPHRHFSATLSAPTGAPARDFAVRHPFGFAPSRMSRSPSCTHVRRTAWRT